MNDTGVSYLFWLGWVFGLAGLHRFYNKKFGTGFLWLFTFGLFGFGQVIDLVLIPGMVEEHNLKLRAKLGYSPNGVPLQPAITQTIEKPPTRDQLMVRLVQAASKRSGKLSVTQAVMDTGVEFTEVEAVLKQMVKSGYVRIDNDPLTGVVVYDFLEL